MKKFLLIGVLIAMAPDAWAQTASAPNTVPTEQEISIVGFNIFKTVCFMMYAPENKEKRTAFLDEKFTRHEGEQKELFLKMAGGKPGEVWGAAFPHAAYAIVVQDSGNCHVVAQKGDAATIHGNLAKLAEDAARNLPDMAVNPVPKTATPVLESSGFELKGSDGKNVMAVIGSTPLKREDNKPAALMTVLVSPE